MWVLRNRRIWLAIAMVICTMSMRSVVLAIDYTGVDGDFKILSLGDSRSEVLSKLEWLQQNEGIVSAISEEHNAIGFDTVVMGYSVRVSVRFGDDSGLCEFITVGFVRQKITDYIELIYFAQSEIYPMLEKAWGAPQMGEPPLSYAQNEACAMWRDERIQSGAADF